VLQKISRLQQLSEFRAQKKISHLHHFGISSEDGGTRKIFLRRRPPSAPVMESLPRPPCATVELGECGTSESGDGRIDGRLELREGGPERVVGVVDVVVTGAEEEVGVEAVELGDGIGQVRVEGREGLGRHQGRVIRVGAEAGVRVLAGELAEEGGEERDDDGGDGVATEDRVPLLDIAAEQLLHEHILRLRRRHRLTVWAGFRADVGVPTRARENGEEREYSWIRSG
jgi:hypothetical protein